MFILLQSFLTESIFGRCDDLESLKTRNCPAESIQNPRGRVEITRNQPTGKEPGKQPKQIIRIQPQDLTLTLRPGEQALVPGSGGDKWGDGELFQGLNIRFFPPSR